MYFCWFKYKYTPNHTFSFTSFPRQAVNKQTTLCAEHISQNDSNLASKRFYNSSSSSSFVTWHRPLCERKTVLHSGSSIQHDGHDADYNKKAFLAQVYKGNTEIQTKCSKCKVEHAFFFFFFKQKEKLLPNTNTLALVQVCPVLLEPLGKEVNCEYI